MLYITVATAALRTVMESSPADDGATATKRRMTPEVGGMAYQTGAHRFTLDAGDPIESGFVLR